MWAFMPVTTLASLSSAMPFAVMVTMGMLVRLCFAAARHIDSRLQIFKYDGSGFLAYFVIIRQQECLPL